FNLPSLGKLKTCRHSPARGQVAAPGRRATMEAVPLFRRNAGAAMTISLTCTCGARLEIDETFAGQTVHCPDCQRPLTTPRPERAGALTSGVALTSLVLALVGAFTLLGTLLAVVFGALALRDIARRPDQVTGKGYAVAGIALGVFLTALTGFALT